MKTAEFPSVIAARNAGMAELAYYYRMMEKSAANKATNPQGGLKTCEFPSVVAAGKVAEEQLSYFKHMMRESKAIKESNKGKPQQYWYANR